jgi:hypothetical protein
MTWSGGEPRMSCRSCRTQAVVFQPVTVINCPAPVLTIGFPPTNPGPNTVTLANGAVVDLTLLGEIVNTFCPALVCP